MYHIEKRNGADYLRNLLDWMNARNETLNENKSGQDLINEYNRELAKEQKLEREAEHAYWKSHPELEP